MDRFRTFTVVVLVAFLMTFSFVGSSDAMKSSGTPKKIIGSTEVCGDQLCDKIPSPPTFTPRSENHCVVLFGEFVTMKEKNDVFSGNIVIKGQHHSTNQP